jgi:transketolase
VDGHDVQAVDEALKRSAGIGRRAPTLIVCRKTVIGKGSPNRAGTAKAHGAALGVEEIAAHARGARHGRTPPSRFRREAYAAWDAQATARRRKRDWNWQSAASTA